MSAGAEEALEPFWKIENMGFLAGGGVGSRSWETLRRRGVFLEVELLAIATGLKVVFFVAGVASEVRVE